MIRNTTNELSVGAIPQSSELIVNNATQGSAQVRFVQGDPKVGALDIYFFQSAGSPTTSTAFANLQCGEATDYQPQTAVPNTLIARVAGSSSSSAAVTACNLPAITNANYSIAIAFDRTAKRAWPSSTSLKASITHHAATRRWAISRRSNTKGNAMV